MFAFIDAIFLDVGNTLRILMKEAPHQAQARQRIAALVGSHDSPEELCALLDARYKTYRKWAFETLIEASEAELWKRWLLPDFPPDKIEPLAGELTYQYRQSMGRRVMQPDGKEIIDALNKRGYLLGIISNVITRQEIPDWLVQDGLDHYFKAVVISSVLGIRKPDPEIFLEAARRAGVAPEKSVYVGDNPSRDVIGARNAGFGAVIIILAPEELAEAPLIGEYKPDLVIHQFKDLLDVFPPRQFQ